MVDTRLTVKTARIGDLVKRKLTARNWKFIKFYIDGKGIVDSYLLAGYKGKSFAAPYEMVQSLKTEIEEIREAQGINRANIMDKANILIDKPLGKIDAFGVMHETTHLSPTEHMKALELARKLTEKQEKGKTNYSPVNIVTSKDGKTQVNFGDGKGDTQELDSNGTTAENEGEKTDGK